jgi:hypothetical protein
LHGDKEDYVIRRLLAAWKKEGRIPFPVELRAETERANEPDFVLTWSNGQILGVEITEAGSEDYQKWLTQTEDSTDPAADGLNPFGPSIDRAAAEIAESISRKIKKYDVGSYRATPACDLVVYDNIASGGFLDKREVVKKLGTPRALLGRFRGVHLVSEPFVFLDLFGNDPVQVDVSRMYEVDYAGWIFDQVERLRQRATDKLDLAYIAEELEDLGNSDRRALGSHLRVLVQHFLKWHLQPERRGDSWRASIENARLEIRELLTESPSLGRDLDKQFVVQFARARKLAAIEMGMPLAQMPEHSPFTLKQVLESEFLPQTE